MIKFLDLKAINDSFEPELSSVVRRVMDSGWYLMGEELRSFEDEYAKYTGTKYCVGTGNGLDALRLILKAYILTGEMKEGDEIIVPANTYIASILAITENRLIPILTEPDNTTYNIDPGLIEEKITSKTRGIMLVHMYGKNAMNPEIERLVKLYGLKLIEDNAQAHGSVYKGIRSGALGHAAGHSFYPGKNLGALGDAGAVTTNDEKLAEMIRALGNYGSSKKYIVDYEGINSRLDEIQAAILKLKLKRLDADNRKRREIAELYLQNISNPDIILPSPERGNEAESHVWHLFVIRHKDRNRLRNYLTEKGIQTLIHYPVPPHKQKAYPDWNSHYYPVTERIHDEVLSLPLSPVLKEEEAFEVIEKINNYIT